MSAYKSYTWKYSERGVTYIWEIWDLDDRFKELHFSGSVEELREAAKENTAGIDKTHKRD